VLKENKKVKKIIIPTIIFFLMFVLGSSFGQCIKQAIEAGSCK